jgi:hypothetical protein
MFTDMSQTLDQAQAALLKAGIGAATVVVEAHDRRMVAGVPWTLVKGKAIVVSGVDECKIAELAIGPMLGNPKRRFRQYF